MLAINTGNVSNNWKGNLDEISSIKIWNTKNYHQFTKIGGNRDIYPTHLKLLIKSIVKSNLLKYNPILVNENKHIIDGQHRFEAAKKLSLPIYYIVCPNYKFQYVIDLNTTTKSWTLIDYMNSYLKKNNPNYILFNELYQKLKFSITLCLMLNNNKIYMNKHNQYQSRSANKDFKEGFLRYTEENHEIALKRGLMLLDIFHHLDFGMHAHLASAFLVIIENPRYDHKKMINQLNKNYNKISIQKNKLNYIRNLEDVYNYQKKEHLRVRFI